MNDHDPYETEALAPDFPLDVLPPAMREYVEAAANSLSVPMEMVAMPMLGLAGGLIGNRLHLVLKNSWREYPTLYIPIVSPPGTAKTPALNHAKWPLDILQDRAHKAAKAEQQARLAEWQARGSEERGPKPTAPEMRHYFSTDLTIEALAGMLESAPGVSIVRDEIGGWVAAMDQYRGGKGSDRQQYLSLWSGQTIKADRKSGPPIYARHPVCCVVGGIQPDLAGDLHHAAQKRDGFVERLLPVVPGVGIAPWTEDAPSERQYREVLALFERLDATLTAIDAARYPINDTAIAGAGLGVHLSQEAKAAFIVWHNDNAALIGASTGLAAGFSSKLPANVARLALILHALWRPDDPRPMVSGEKMADVIELAEFCRAHTGRFLALLQRVAPGDSAGLDTRIMRIMRNANQATEEGWVSRSHIYRRLRNVTPDALFIALEDLVGRKVLAGRIASGSTKSASEYRIRISHYSHYSSADGPQPGENENSANEEIIVTMVKNLQTLTLDELRQYREELDVAPAGDPDVALDRAALARFDQQSRGTRMDRGVA